MTPQEAAVAFAQAGAISTREDIEKVLGKALIETTERGNKKVIWIFYRNSIWDMDAFVCALTYNGDGTVNSIGSGQEHFAGPSAWVVRWMIMKSKFGIK